MNNQNLATQKQKKMGSLLITIIITALIVGGGVYILTKFFTREEATKPPLPQTELRTFQGEKLGISFQYPAEWGAAEETIRNAVSDKPEKGKLYGISFTNNPYLSIGGASKNTRIDGIGLACHSGGFFNSDYGSGVLSCADCKSKFPAKCDDPDDPLECYYNECLNCKETFIDGQLAVSFIFVPSINCSLNGFDQEIYLLTPYKQKDDDFPGLFIQMDLVTHDDTLLYDLAMRATTGRPESAEEKKQMELLGNDFVELRTKSKGEFANNDLKNYLTIQQIKQLEDFVQSIKFSDQN